MKAKTVLILEPKGTMLEVVRSAKAKGYEVISIMTEPSALVTIPMPYNSAVGLIDSIVEVESWNQNESLLKLLKELQENHNIVGVYFGTDACARIGCLIREKLKLPTVSYQNMTTIVNKRQLRQKLRENHLSKIHSISNVEAESLTEWPFLGDAFFKPIYGSFSLGVKRCQDLEDLKTAKEELAHLPVSIMKYMSDYMSSTSEYILEEAFEGELLSVEAFSSNGNFTVIGLTSRILYSKNTTVEMGSCFPYEHPLSSKIINLVKSAHLVLGFTDGPSHTEVMVNAKGEVEIIDFNPRFVGADVLQSINFAYGIKIEELLLAFALGERINFDPKQNLYSCLQYVLAPEPLTFQNIQFPSAPEVKFTATFVSQGKELKDVSRQIDYVGTYLTVMPSFIEALNRSKELRSQILINFFKTGEY